MTRQRLWMLIGPYAAIGLAEFIPFVDVLPTYVAAVILAYLRSGQAG